MAASNRTSYAILGLLAQGAKSGYEIKQVVEHTISHFWKESYGHLYPTLSRLMAEGLVGRESLDGGYGRERQRYHITERGRAALQSWLAAPLEAEGTRNELALKLYFGASAPPAISRAHLVDHREQQRHLLERYGHERPKLEARLAVGEEAASYDLIALSLGTHIAQARIAWCEDALALLDRLDPTTSNTGA